MKSDNEFMKKEEHTQALLADDELGDGNSDSLDSRVPRFQRNRQQRNLFWSSLVAIATLVILAAVFGTDIFRQRQRSVLASPVVQDSYVLSNDWDYSAPSRVRQYEWTLEETVFNPDGVYRPMLLINNQFPGPLIEANEGDTIKVIVDNRMKNATSIHWHGIYQNGTNFMDGTTGVTQCPIAPGSSFTYEFTVNAQSGTYWYHAHQSTQALDGLAGPLIIHSKDERESQKLEYVSDRVILLSDHYHRLTSGLTRQYLAPDMENTEPVPDGALINGRAVRNCDELPTRKCDNSTVEHARFNLKDNARHRLRVINIGAFAEFQFQIDEHELAVVEADGTDLQPAYHHMLKIAPGQRYSVIVNANHTHRNDFLMRARMITDCFTGINKHTVNEVQAIVSYNEDQILTSLPDAEDWNEQTDTECRDMNTTELVPATQVPVPEKEDVFYYLRTNFRIGAYRLSRGFFNESTWKSNTSTPTLLQFLDNQNPTQQHPSNPLTTPNQLTVQTEGIQTIDLLIHNTDDGAHPMHLHGHKFFILASGKGYPPRTSLLEGVSRSTVQPLYDTLNLTNPLRRDTASVEADGWMLIRFVADNPGAWAFHCHISWHAEAGLMMQFLTRVDELAKTDVPGANRRLCEASYAELEKGATPVDEVYYAEAIDGSERNGSGCEGESARECGYGD